MNELQYLDSLQGSGIRPGLERMRRMLRAAGHPERACPAVIVAGTNGKGSTAATLGSILRASTYIGGLYTSPHLVDLGERWILNGQPVSRTLLRHSIGQLPIFARRCGIQPTYFEALTILAFLLFRDLRCQIAVLEVGMGGRLDATNVVRPLLSLITTVSFDHAEYLGDTLRAIAREKAGVIHRGSIALTSSRNPEVLEVLRRRATSLDVSLHLIGEETTVEKVSHSAERLRFTLRTPWDRYSLASPLLGLHQIDNISLAVRAAEELQPRFPGISHEAIEQGVAETRWRGRLERFEVAGKRIWVDGGHNVEAAERIAEFVETYIPRPRTLVFGIMRDKEVEKVAGMLFPHFEELILTRAPTDRAARTGPLAEIARAMGHPFRRAARPSNAFRLALELAPRVVLVCGSLYLAGEAVRFFDRQGAATAPVSIESDENGFAAATNAR